MVGNIRHKLSLFDLERHFIALGYDALFFGNGDAFHSCDYFSDHVTNRFISFDYIPTANGSFAKIWHGICLISFEDFSILHLNQPGTGLKQVVWSSLKGSKPFLHTLANETLRIQ